MLFNKRQGFGFQGQNMMGCCPEPNACQPVVEPTITKCVQKDCCYEVPHVCPIHTHVINRHIYRHNYVPQYTCSEENQVVNLDCGSCSQFL